MEIGDRVLAVGAPFGLTGTVTNGIISGKGRALHMNMYEDFIQTDAAINPGNSGGPLINLEGKVIGINSVIKSRSGGFQGVGLAIASNLAQNIMQQLLQNGVVHRGYLGVQIQDVDSQGLANRLGLKEPHGTIVTRVFEDTPGAKAGLKSGDVIVNLAGKPVKDGRELQSVVAGLTVGKPVELSIIRDGKPRTLSVTVEEQPQTFGTTRAPEPRVPERPRDAVAVDKIGVEAVDLTDELAERLGFREGRKGAVISRVDRGGLSWEGGLRRGLLVTQVDKKAVSSARGLRDLVDKGSLDRGILLRVETPDGVTSYVLLKANADVPR
jgi:serine protease Do